jgi:hypothetical protein
MQLDDKALRKVIVACILKVKYKDTDILRELAKRPEVKNTWTLCKNLNLPMFPGLVLQWNPLQRRLCFWLSYYSSIEGAYNRPPEWIIRNNELLDKWMKQQVEDSERESEQNWRKGKVDVPRTPYDHDEVYELETL